MLKYSKVQIRKAVEDSNGTFTSVARNLKCKSSLTAKKNVEKYPDILEIFHEIQDGICDQAENTLMENLKSQNEFVKARTCEFILKNMPRSHWKEQAGEDLQSQLVKLLDKMMDSAEGSKDKD